MNYLSKTKEDHFQNDGKPKRILSLDGGGLKGVITLGILAKIEKILRMRYGNDSNFRLCHYFDLIAGTSTGSIIAASLAIGLSVEEILTKYMDLGRNVFEKSLFRLGFFRAKYDHNKLSNELQNVFGPDTELGSDTVKTGLLIVTKRIDTGSCWPISNNPKGKYYESRPGGTIGNKYYPLWKVVRASTAAPDYFDPESLIITEKEGYKPVKGDFVDGGVSCFNNPAFQAFMYVTLDGYHIRWPTGKDKLLLISIGTGLGDPQVKTTGIAAEHAIRCLSSLMDDCESLQEILLQWISNSRNSREIDREIGNLHNDLIAGIPLLAYSRYNVDLQKEKVGELMPELSENEISILNQMDTPDNMDTLYRLGLSAQKQVGEEDFPGQFDIKID